MARALLIAIVCLVSFSTSIGGRYRIPIKRGSRLDLAYDRVQLAGNVAALVVEVLLPIATGFLGVPLFAACAALCQAGALMIYKVQLPPIRIVRPGTSGLHSVHETELRRYRWPYQTLFPIGYVFLLAYALTVARHYF
jgi:hypothetical protein